MSDTVISAKLPEDLLNKVDEIIDNGQYDNRSEFVREVIRGYTGMADMSEEDRLKKISGQASAIKGMADSMTDEMNEDSE